MKRSLLVSLSTAAIAVVAMCWAPQANAEGLKVGDVAPEFKMVGSDGKTYTLSQFKGKQPVVIAWYPKAFTGG